MVKKPERQMTALNAQSEIHPFAHSSLWPHIPCHRERVMERREGKVGRGTEGEDRRRRETKRKISPCWTRLFGSTLEPKCLLSTTHTMVF